MKITGIEIGEYRQFKNIKFDFTYPNDHPKAGQPLDKVCFIGQSGTGKTTLLNVIWDLVNTIKEAIYLNNYENENDIVPDNFIPDSLFFTTFFLDIEKNIVVFDRERLIGKSDVHFLWDWIKQRLSKTEFYKISDINKFCLYIKESISREADALLFDQKNKPQTFSDFIKTDTQVEKEKFSRDEYINNAGSRKVISLGDMESISIWQYLLKEIDSYDTLTVQRITAIVQNTPKNKLQEELQKWIDADPRHELAEKCLNPILNKFFLELDTNARNVPITLRTTGGVKIDSSYLSTGTRQVLATAIPLYKFDTNGTIILFDEPERSLFPDIQRILINYYTSLAPEAQFFFATHSPITASAFEPCERFILYFDENGEVKFRNGVAPEGDDPNDVLRQDFGISPLMLDEGVKQYRKYLDLATQIRNETDTSRKMELIAERSVIGNKYNFPVTNETN